jgi:hypothetical protein
MFWAMSCDPARKQALSDAMSAPRRAANDEGSYETHSLTEQIELDKHLCDGEVATDAPANSYGARVFRGRPPGAI